MLPPVQPLVIGGVRLPNNLILAPMAGVTDGPFRRLCGQLGVGLTVSELASAKAILNGNKTTIGMFRYDGQPRPFSAQIFGSDPSTMAEAARRVEALGIADLIDINMGCPVSKVVKTGAGAALMKTPELAEKIIKAVAAAVSVPVTVKFRLGWGFGQLNFRTFAKMAVDAGVAAVTIHARTREAGYAGTADWEKLEGMQDLCGEIPFIANGDLETRADLERVHAISGCRGFMIGRKAIGRPWLFARLAGEALVDFAAPGPHEEERPSEKWFRKGEEPSAAIKDAIFREHLIEMMMEHGAKGVPLFRVHLFNYLRGHPQASFFRREMCNQRDPVVVLDAGRRFFLE